MELNVIAYLGLLLAVGVQRLWELQVTKRHKRSLLAQGASEVPDPHFRWMALFHTFVLVGAALEVVFLHRPFYPIFAALCFAIFIASNALRWWVIRTLGEHWSVHVMDSTAMGIVTTGPFRYVRHPNYAAVFVEMIALPLIHCAWITAVAGSIMHVVVLSQRLATEDRVLFSDARYREAMAGKPRFVPGLF